MVSGANFSGGENYTCAFGTGGRSVGASLDPIGAVVLCSSPPLSMRPCTHSTSSACAPRSSVNAPLEISPNGQDFTSANLHFLHYAVPLPSAISPTSGPSGGGTRVRVTGASLSGGSDYHCRFGGGRNSSIDNATVEVRLHRHGTLP